MVSVRVKVKAVTKKPSKNTNKTNKVSVRVKVKAVTKKPSKHIHKKINKA